VRLLWLVEGEVRQARGVIPVGAGASDDLVFMDYRDGKWSVIADPPAPPIHYAGFGEPLSGRQLEALARPEGRR